MAKGKYRHRTELRERLPEALAALIPKGGRDCGDHEWYKAAEQTWRCYHCAVGVTRTVPWDAQELDARKHEAAAALVRGRVPQRDRHTITSS